MTSTKARTQALSDIRPAPERLGGVFDNFLRNILYPRG